MSRKEKSTFYDYTLQRLSVVDPGYDLTGGMDFVNGVGARGNVAFEAYKNHR